MKGLLKQIGKQLGKRIAVIALAGCMTAVMAGCGSVSKDAVYINPESEKAEDNYDSAGVMGGESYDYGEMQSVSFEENYEMGHNNSSQTGKNSAVNPDSSRKLIRTVNMSVETKEFDQLIDTLQEQVQTLGGYIENMETYNGSTYYGYSECKSASITIRMPKDELQGFLDTVSGICNIVRRSENVEDVTLAYVDMESRKKALRTEQERLLAFLEQAETIEEIITIEDRLTNVRYELESMESQLRTYDNKIDYATICIDIEEVQELTPVVEEEKTAWERIEEGFMTNLKDVGRDLKNFGIGFVIRIPYMLVWAAVIAVIYVIIRLIIRGSKKRRQKCLLARQCMQMPTQGQQDQTAVQVQQAPAGSQQEAQHQEITKK